MSGGLNFLAWVKEYKGLDPEHISDQLWPEFQEQFLEYVKTP